MLLLPAALANGLTTHVWIAMEARGLVEDAELAAFVTDPEVEPYLRNGAQFPDGGYPLGEAYAETAHWEPLQSLYLDWIRATYGGPPYEGEARQHVAFLLGMAAHGISDQTFDSMYFERAYVYDAKSDFGYSFDEATDVCIAAGGAAQIVPEPWIPYDAILPLFAQLGVEVSAETLDQGQALTGIAIASVAAMSEVPSTVEMYTARFPWGCGHILDAEVEGSPPNEAIVTAAYWAQLWGRLSGTWTFDEPLMARFPPEGAWDHPTDAMSIEAQVSFLVTRGLVVDSLLPGVVTVADDQGHVYTPDLRLYYGQNSHAVLLLPNEDWADDADFEVTVAPGLATIGGDVSDAPFTFSFTTRAAPLEDTGDTGDTGGTPGADPACGCSSTSGSVAALGLLAGLLSLRRARR